MEIGRKWILMVPSDSWKHESMRNLENISWCEFILKYHLSQLFNGYNVADYIHMQQCGGGI